jgi:hypothetical protein
MRYGVLVWLLAILVWPPGLRAAEKPKTPGETLQTIKQDWSKLGAQLRKRYDAAKSEEEKAKLFEAWDEACAGFARRAIELARTHPDAPESFDALYWVTTRMQYVPAAAGAFELVRRRYVGDKRIGPGVGRCDLYWRYYPRADQFLREVIQKNHERNVQGLACFTLAEILPQYVAVVHGLSDPAKAKGLEAILSKDVVARLKVKDGHGIREKHMLEEADQLYQRVVDRYADLKPPDDKRTLGQRAEAALFEMRHLVVGKKAPEIVGDDIDGKRFKLSDYRGKVVLLDFWGNW